MIAIGNNLFRLDLPRVNAIHESEELPDGARVCSPRFLRESDL